MNKDELLRDLAQFCGTENYTRHQSLLLTDGAKFLAEEASCWWLMDLIWSHQLGIHKKHGQDGLHFQVWFIERYFKGEDPTDTFLITCEDGNNNVLAQQDIPYSDFPLDEFKLYCIDGVVMLPGEY